MEYNIECTGLVLFASEDCQWIFELMSEHSVSYKIKNQELFNQKTNGQNNRFVCNVINRAIGDYMAENLKVTDLSSNMLIKKIPNKKVKEYALDDADITGFEITKLEINKIEMEKDIQKPHYDECMKKLNINTPEQTVPVKDPEPLKEENNMMPLYIGLVIVVVAIVGIIFYKKKNK